MKKLLVANRGEIAVRIIRACRDYGIASVAAYSDADAGAPFVRMADEAFALDGTRPADSYLDIEKLIAIARRSGADAVHPGYGFLSERAEFARAVQDAGLIFVGPDPDVIERLGDKVRARAIARRVGAPLVAGSDGPVASADEAMAFAERFGLPVAIKAAHGGGGRGMKVASALDDIPELFQSAVREATLAFGRGEVFLERFLDRPRHVEAQVLADRHGKVVVVGTRDCSMQRRNQKLIEEAPAPFLSPDQRAAIHRSAKDICAAAGYSGAGTVEFLLGRDGTLSFLEVNTRLQVEHPVTEETTGLDLVVWQLRIADGEALSFTETPEPRGHSIEFRINAEDPGRGFLPAPGVITRFDPPSGPGIRLDSGVTAGSRLTGDYDSLIAKLVVTGATRSEALARARRALEEFQIEGLPTVLDFHRSAVRAEDFTADKDFAVHTRWIETIWQPTAPSPRPELRDETPLIRSLIEIDGRMVRIGLPAGVFSGIGALAPASAPPTATAEDHHGITAPMTGTLIAAKVSEGDFVEAGALVAVIEAMKMEVPVHAKSTGRVRWKRSAGAAVHAGEMLATFED